VLLATLGFGRRLLVWLPMPLRMAMLAGSIMGDVINVIGSSVSDAAVAGSTVAAYVVGRALHNRRVPPLGLALVVGGVAVAVMHSTTPAPVDWTLPSLVVPAMHFSLSSFLAVSLPLIVLSLDWATFRSGYLSSRAISFQPIGSHWCSD